MSIVRRLEMQPYYIFVYNREGGRENGKVGGREGEIERGRRERASEGGRGRSKGQREGAR